ncbi:carboxymuconolactone decarboxylase family protein [Alphaproteobacteria bacterium]|jgi:AhpD family alkylhydroperoxidase|nr:carboxymuconolactone decarboxylase family protein [Alphaproteobacteria bacterium]
MKIILFVILYFTISLSTLKADDHIKTNPITTPMEPEAFLGAYTEMILKMANFQKESGFDAKTFELFALSAAAGMKCEYCIVAHTAMAKKAGATQDEIKTAIMVAGVVSLNSTVMYGNQYDQEKWRKMFK